MSPRAALRLEQLGFRDVYDYVAGKNDWLAAGLPREGEAASILFAGDVADKDVPTCALDERVEDVVARLESAAHEVCVAVDGGGVVLGVLPRAADANESATVRDAMEPGPTTIRASEQLQPLVERMGKAEAETVLVTDPEGRLLGLLRREAAEHALHESR